VLSHLGHRHTIGINRRELLQVGYSGLLGFGLSDLLSRQAAAAADEKLARKPKSVIIVFLTGAPSHLDMFDMKPEAPPEDPGGVQTDRQQNSRRHRLRALAAAGRSSG